MDHESAFGSEEPFGKPDGASDDITHSLGSVVHFPKKYGGIARDPSDARVRVVVGQLGAGKSLHLRRMQDHIAHHGGGGEFAVKVETSSDLTTRNVVKFSQILKLRGGNTEDWKLLWRRAIIRSAVSHILCGGQYRHLPDDIRTKLNEYSRMLGEPRTPHRVTQEAQTIIHDYDQFGRLTEYLNNPRWADIEYIAAEALNATLGLYLYIDDIDKNFRWAPSYWIQCQRGLFYAVMDFLRDEELRGKLHVVVALRDITFSSIRVSEQASRYVELTHINTLSWTRPSMRHLLDEKLKLLPDEYFSDSNSRNIKSWIGLTEIANSRTNSTIESAEDYLLRHTSMVPRDLIHLGNRLCQEIRFNDGIKPTEQKIRSVVSEVSAESANRQIAQTANQVLSDIAPPDASLKNYDDYYVDPTGYTLHAAANSVMESISVCDNDVFGIDLVDAIDRHASELFNSDKGVNLCDILWQQRLLGYIDASGGNYYQLDGIDGVGLALPRKRSIENYVLNPILFDLRLGINASGPTPIWPK